MSFIDKYRQHYLDNLNLAIPVVISQLGYTLVQTADTVIVGHFAERFPWQPYLLQIVSRYIAYGWHRRFLRYYTIDRPGEWP